jgi:capsular polysaccharide biosynthesis protein
VLNTDGARYSVAGSDAKFFDLQQTYNDVAYDGLCLLLRRRVLISVALLGGLVFALALVNFWPRSYTAQAIIRLDFARQNANSLNIASVDGIALAETDAEFIRSRGSVRNIASTLYRYGGFENGNQPSRLRSLSKRVMAFISPDIKTTDPVDAVADAIQSHLQISSMPRAYLITINYTAKNPQQAALIANAFAHDFFIQFLLLELAKQEATASQELTRLSSLYGPKHPAVAEAEAVLRNIRAQAKESRNPLEAEVTLPPGVAFIPADPAVVTSTPKASIVIAVVMAGSLLTGMILALLLEKLRKGFRTAREVKAVCGVPCVGMIPRRSSKVGDRAIAKAFWLLALEAFNKPGSTPPEKILAISSSVSEGADTRFGEQLAAALVDCGNRVLHLNLRMAAQDPGRDIHALEHVLSDAESTNAFFEKEETSSYSVIAPIGTSPIDRQLSAMQRFLSTAGNDYDLIIIEVPSLLQSLENLRIVALAGIHLHLAAWDYTPRSEVCAAIDRFDKAAASVTAVVLLDVNVPRYLKFREIGSLFYIAAEQAP